ncbi:hypothetical protein Agabi119p4_5262 [Agaricus bisporus var. burnettii]|uniref:Uncharacterized protein n=1 Tax=Agaricus bisporus var. burnettii TaxID=192524 RepID=A0A8H7F4V6_AGABI|nr:hypothetical protein Agabi119p4_5262 [Agaricus bisporus var. burnettii]
MSLCRQRSEKELCIEALRLSAPLPVATLLRLALGEQADNRSNLYLSSSYFLHFLYPLSAMMVQAQERRKKNTKAWFSRLFRREDKVRFSKDGPQCHNAAPDWRPQPIRNMVTLD